MIRTTKKVTILNGAVINVGEWDYQYTSTFDENGLVTGKYSINPLPEGAVEEEKDVVFDGIKWYLESEYEKSKKPTTEQILQAKIEMIVLNLLIDSGVI